MLRLRQPPSSGRTGADGYSLLEVLIALTILALAATLVMPGITGSLGAVTRQTLRRDVEQQFLAARLKALDEETPLVVSMPPQGDGSPPQPVRDIAGDPIETVYLKLPTEWGYELDRPVNVAADGHCTAAILRLKKAGERDLAFKVDPDKCQPVAE